MGVAVNVKLVLALLLSGVLQSDRRSIRLLSALFLLPWAIPVLPGILSIRWMMSSQWGILNLIARGPRDRHRPLAGLALDGPRRR